MGRKRRQSTDKWPLPNVEIQDYDRPPALAKLGHDPPRPPTPIRLLPDYQNLTARRGYYISFPVLILIGLLVVFESSFLFVYTLLGLYRTLPTRNFATLAIDPSRQHRFTATETVTAPARQELSTHAPAVVIITELVSSSASERLPTSQDVPTTFVSSSSASTSTAEPLSSLTTSDATTLPSEATGGSQVETSSTVTDLNVNVHTVTAPVPTVTVLSTAQASQPVVTQVVFSTAE